MTRFVLKVGGAVAAEAARAVLPLAEEVNEIGLRGVSAQERAATQRTLMAIIDNMSREAPTLSRSSRR